jgi:hypothetical protein
MVPSGPAGSCRGFRSPCCSRCSWTSSCGTASDATDAVSGTETALATDSDLRDLNVPGSDTRPSAANSHTSGSRITEDCIDAGPDGVANERAGLVAAASATATTAAAVDDHEHDHHHSDCNKSCDHPSFGCHPDHLSHIGRWPSGSAPRHDDAPRRRRVQPRGRDTALPTAGRVPSRPSVSAETPASHRRLH